MFWDTLLEPRKNHCAAVIVVALCHSAAIMEPLYFMFLGSPWITWFWGAYVSTFRPITSEFNNCLSTVDVTSYVCATTHHAYFATNGTKVISDACYHLRYYEQWRGSKRM